MNNQPKNVRTILEKKLGRDKSGILIKGINSAYNRGKRGCDLQVHFNNALKERNYPQTFFPYVIEPGA
ncbi:MAG: hypothetical protein GY757_45735 [bacterium]|nr:hypothetical protein [bacterium]